MAKTTKVTKPTFVNEVTVSGTVNKIISNTDKVTKFVIDSTKETENGKVSHAFLMVVCFAKLGVHIGDIIKVMGTLRTSTYNGVFRVEIYAEADDIELI